jgi:hypothetical protein
MTARGAIVEKGQQGRKAIGDYLNNIALQTPQTTMGADLVAMASTRSS